jgi:hypothetical protein
VGFVSLFGAAVLAKCGLRYLLGYSVSPRDAARIALAVGPSPGILLVLFKTFSASRVRTIAAHALKERFSDFAARCIILLSATDIRIVLRINPLRFLVCCPLPFCTAFLVDINTTLQVK